MIDNYLENIKNQFLYYKSLGDKTIEQLSDAELLWQPNESSNSISIIVGHLSGNMKSRWTDFLTTDGEKDWRNRDKEFEPFLDNRKMLLQHWEEGWACLFAAIESVNPDNCDRLVYIRNQGHTIVEAFNRQACHYASHVGQMVYLGKMIKNNSWTSLSIEKGKSKKYNAEKFSLAKNKTDAISELVKNNEQN